MWITVAQFLLSLSILVVLHELGHFSAAKWFKTKVEKFYLFFNPGFSLFKVQKGETEYGIGWLPLGGYVKIAGMIDESFDKEQMKGEPQPWEFRSKPAWQRLIIMVGGVFVNFVLGILIFWMLSWHYGENYIVNESLPYGIAVDSTAYNLGLRDGDMIVSIGDAKFDEFSSGQLTKALVIDGVRTIEIRRNGQTLTLTPSEESIAAVAKQMNSRASIISPRLPYEIGGFSKESMAEKANVKKGDRVIMVNGEPTPYGHQFIKAITRDKDDQVNLSVLRGGETLAFSVPFNKDGKIGVMPESADKYLDFQTRNYDFLPALERGWERSYGFLADQIKAFGQMFSGKLKAKDSLGSFITIGSMFGTDWDWQRFWTLTASLSIILGFINLLPIPALDGGYVMFLFWEIITGKKVSDKTLEVANMIGFFILIALMIYALGLDIWRNFF